MEPFQIGDLKIKIPVIQGERRRRRCNFCNSNWYDRT